MLPNYCLVHYISVLCVTPCMFVTNYGSYCIGFFTMLLKWSSEMQKTDFRILVLPGLYFIIVSVLFCCYHTY